MNEIIATESTNFDLKEIVASLNNLLKLRTIPIGMKMFESIEEMESIPKIRRPSAVHTTDQIVGQACRNGWTVGITVEDLVGPQCSTVIGLSPRDDKWLSGDRMAGVWFSDLEGASDHHKSMDVVEHG